MAASVAAPAPCTPMPLPGGERGEVNAMTLRHHRRRIASAPRSSPPPRASCRPPSTSTPWLDPPAARRATGAAAARRSRRTRPALAILRGGVTLGAPIAPVVWNKDHELEGLRLAHEARRRAEVHPGPARPRRPAAPVRSPDDARDVLEAGERQVPTAVTVALGSLRSSSPASEVRVIPRRRRRKARSPPARRPPPRELAAIEASTCTSTTRPPLPSGAPHRRGSAAVPSAASLEAYAEGLPIGPARIAPRPPPDARLAAALAASRPSARRRRRRHRRSGAPGRSSTTPSTGRRSAASTARRTGPVARGRHDRRDARDARGHMKPIPHHAHAAPTVDPASARPPRPATSGATCAVPAAAGRRGGRGLELANASSRSSAATRSSTWRGRWRRMPPDPLRRSPSPAHERLGQVHRGAPSAAPRPTGGLARRGRSRGGARKPVPGHLRGRRRARSPGARKDRRRHPPAGVVADLAAAFSATPRRGAAPRGGRVVFDVSAAREAARRLAAGTGLVGSARSPRAEPLLARRLPFTAAPTWPCGGGTRSPPEAVARASGGPCDRRAPPAGPRGDRRAPGGSLLRRRGGRSLRAIRSPLRRGTGWCRGHRAAGVKSPAAGDRARRSANVVLVHLPDGERGKTLAEPPKARRRGSRAGCTRGALSSSPSGAGGVGRGGVPRRELHARGRAALPTTLLAISTPPSAGRRA